MMVISNRLRAVRAALVASVIVFPHFSARAVPIQVTYTDGPSEGFNDPTLGAQRRTAFEAALGNWSSKLLGNAPITVSASMDPLGGTANSAVLGQAYATYDTTLTGGSAFPNTYYSAALACELVGQDINPGVPMITAQFNSDVDNSTVLGNINWYYGTNAQPGSNVDFYEVVLHECGHGLGFFSFLQSNGAYLNNAPTVYDQFLAEGPAAGAVKLVTESQAQRNISVKGGALYFAGPNTRTANGGTNGVIYAPTSYQQGSSTSHLDQTTYQGTSNALMCPVYSITIHDAGTIGNAVFKDEGWGFNTPPVANNQSVFATPDTTTGITLTASDVDNQALTYSIVSGPSHGTISTGTSASRTYTPSAGFTGQDSFTFKANDGQADSNVATVTIFVAYPAPSITNFSPTSGHTGTGVTITGQHFGHGASVKFNGVSAISQPNSDTEIDCTVPSGATTGPITVTAMGGSVTTATNFTVIPISQPSGSTTYASNVAGDSATLHASINPGNQSTTAYFQTGQNLPYDGPNTPTQNIGSGGGAVDVAAPLTGLSSGTTYHYRARATNNSGDVVFGDSYFVTLAPGGGTALQFDGVSAAVAVPGFGQAAPPTSEVTVEFWQNVNSVKQQGAFVMSPDNLNNRFNAHVPWEDGQVYWDFGDIFGGGRLLYNPPANQPIPGHWEHWAFVSSAAGNFMKIYRNGVEVATQNSHSAFTPGSGTLEIGGMPGFWLAGQLDEFRIWNRARGAAEIQHDMKRRLVGNESGLVRYFRFDDGAGVTPVDSSPTNGGGTFVGAPLWVASTAPIGSPILETDAATSVTTTTATLNGLVNPNGYDTSAHFEWGTDTTYGNSTAVQTPGSGTSDVALSAPLAGLSQGVTYHYRIVASNVVGADAGVDQTFTTPALYSLQDVTMALQSAAGLYTPTAAEAARWNVETGAPTGQVTVADAARLARKVAGVDANP